jgi:hypothetical protein
MTPGDDDEDDDVLMDYEDIVAKDTVAAPPITSTSVMHPSVRPPRNAEDEEEDGEIPKRAQPRDMDADAEVDVDVDAMGDEPDMTKIMTSKDPAYVELDAEDLRCAEHVARSIREPKRHLIRVLVKRFGRDAASEALRETLRIEREGGSMYEEGCEGSGSWKRRTKAGCFLWVFKKQRADARAVAAAFEESKEIDRRIKAFKRERGGGGGRGRGRGRGRPPASVRSAA